MPKLTLLNRYSAKDAIEIYQALASKTASVTITSYNYEAEQVCLSINGNYITHLDTYEECLACLAKLVKEAKTVPKPVALPPQSTIAGVVVLNSVIFPFDDINMALKDDTFESMVDKCNYSDTGGGWRTTYKQMRDMITQFCEKDGTETIGHLSQHPSITIKAD